MFRFFFKNKLLQLASIGNLKGLVAILSLSFWLSAYAESASDKDSPLMEEVRVEGLLLNSSGLGLNQANNAASRLGLSLFELPASVELIDQTEIAIKGDYSGLSAVTRATGIASSASPGNGGTAVSVRGFNGHSSVVYTYDGIRLYVGAGTVSFPADTWTVDRVEVLRGPGSVTNGVGAIGATINYVPKKPNEEKYEHQVVLTGGSNDLYRIAVGSGGPINSELSYRFDAVRHRTEGYVDRAEEKRDAVAGTLQYRLGDVVASFSIDYAKTDAAPYWGTPLVEGAVLDSIRRNNYNVDDGLIEYEDL
ncbi:MAG: TonB-dependent receptor plug domain-containing protein, partial [Pseudomonadales bacterium]|nr:TonB-dependent receptor plug domain-containing protein [Pseudomonadales bacterium]